MVLISNLKVLNLLLRGVNTSVWTLIWCQRYVLPYCPSCNDCMVAGGVIVLCCVLLTVTKEIGHGCLL